jgi:NADH dehydrogenase
VWIGSVAGLVTGLVVGLLQVRQGMMAIDATGLSPGTGAAVAVTVLGGVVIGSFLDHRPRRLPALVTTGVLAGLLWWAVEWLTVLPVLAGHRVTWSLADAQAAFGFLIGGMIQGGTTAVLVHLVSLRLGSKVGTADTGAAMGVERTRVVIVGGGFAGVSVAQRLERRLSGRDDVEIVLVSDSNHQLFTPMLAGVAAGTLQERHIGAPVRAVVRRAVYRHAALHSVDTDGRRIEIRPEGAAAVRLPFDHLVLAVGSVPDFRDVPGVRRYALPLKTLSHAVRLRTHIIRQLELADVEASAAGRRRRLTVVVAGGGFAGAELIAEIRDMAHGLRRYFPQLDPDEFRFVLVHAQERILPELQPRLAALAQRRLREKGVEVRLAVRVANVTEERVTLDDDTVIDTATVVWTAGNAPNPLVRRLGFTLAHGALACEPTMLVQGQERVWALGDCAAVPDPAAPDRYYPPTAQHAVREGAAVADNIIAVLDGRAPKPFRFRTIALLVTLGHQDGAAQIGRWLLSGRLAWVLWRSVYLAKLPGLEKKIQVALDWSFDLFFPRDVVLTEPVNDDEPAEPAVGRP